MSRTPPSLQLAALAVLAAAGGCAAGGDYPSLAPRPIEGVSLAEPATRPVPEPTPAATADARYAVVVERARAADAEFRRRLADAEPVLRAGRDAAIGSDAWAAAEQAISRLQAARGPVAEAVAALQDAGEAPDTRADRGLADAAARARGAVDAIDAAEADALARATPARS